MDLPISIQNICGLAVLALIIGLLVWMHLRQPGSGVIGYKAPILGFGYEWTATSVPKAKPDMLTRFPELQSVVNSVQADDINLVRFGLFNMTEDIIEEEQVTHPVEIRFPNDTTVLSVTFSEALKTEWKVASEPTVEGNMVRLPIVRMSPRSSLIFNFILSGDVRSLYVVGSTREHGSIMRVG